MLRVLTPLPIPLALAACGQPQGAENATIAADEKANRTIPAAVVSAPTPPASAADFVAKAAGGDGFEIAAAQAAQAGAQPSPPRWPPSCRPTMRSPSNGCSS